MLCTITLGFEAIRRLVIADLVAVDYDIWGSSRTRSWLSARSRNAKNRYWRSRHFGQRCSERWRAGWRRRRLRKGNWIWQDDGLLVGVQERLELENIRDVIASDCINRILHPNLRLNHNFILDGTEALIVCACSSASSSALPLPPRPPS